MTRAAQQLRSEHENSFCWSARRRRWMTQKSRGKRSYSWMQTLSGSSTSSTRATGTIRVRSLALGRCGRFWNRLLVTSSSSTSTSPCVWTRVLTLTEGCPRSTSKMLCWKARLSSVGASLTLVASRRSIGARTCWERYVPKMLVEFRTRRTGAGCQINGVRS